MNYNSRENQISTNKLIIAVIGIKILLGLTLCTLIRFINRDSVFYSIFVIYFLPLYAVNIIISLIVIRIGLDRRVSGYILFGELIFSIYVSFLVFGTYSSLFLIIPVIVSARALNRRESLLVSLLTWFSSVVAMFVNVYLHKTSDLIRVLHEYQEETVWNNPKDVFSYYFVPITFAFAVILLVSDNIIKNGKKQIKMEIKLSSELAAAALIQQSTLPGKSFSTPDGRISIETAEKPAKEMDGDFFDYIMLDNRHVAFLVADVTDKGVPAALFMMAAQKAIHICLQENNNLSRAVFCANNMLCQNNTSNMFLTMWIGIADTEDNTVEFVNCGHPMPVLYDSDNNVRFVENVPNLFIGCFENAEFPVNRVTFNKGDRLIVYTDGITDTRDKNDRTFGEDGLVTLIRNGIFKPDDIISECLRFSDGTAQFDDMTVMEVSFN